MRELLKEFEVPFWDQSIEELKQTVNFVKIAIGGYWKMLPFLDKEIKSHEVELIIEMHGREANFLIQFGFWRLQGIFETLLKQLFNIDQKTQGLYDIITIIKKKKWFILKESDLMQWKNFRNDLTHKPTERLNIAAVEIKLSDLDEYLELLIEIYKDFEKQVANKNGLTS